MSFDSWIGTDLKNISRFAFLFELDQKPKIPIQKNHWTMVHFKDV